MAIMANKVLKIEYEEYTSLDEMDPQDRALAEAAIDAIKGSYAPYSRFNVGAAVRLADGTVYTGANQENAAYPSGLCAERTAMFYAHSHNAGQRMCSIAVAASQNGVLCASPATPCGDCRQVMAEFQTEGGAPMTVILVGGARIWKYHDVDSILPFIFDSL